MSTTNRYRSLFITNLKRMMKDPQGFTNLGGLAVVAALALLSQPGIAQTPVTTIENENEETVLSSFEDGGFFLGGEFEEGTIPVEGEGIRLMWYPGKAAFRAGRVTSITGFASGNEWDDNSVGEYSMAFGLNTTASAFASMSMGAETSSKSFTSTAMGFFTTASGQYTTAMGYSTTATTEASLSIGASNSANQTDDGTLFVAGNGELGSPSDALVLGFDGNLEIAGTLNQNSDRRLKKDIRPVNENALKKLNQIQPVRYQFKNQKTHPAGTQIGLIAQEVQEQFPELINEGSGGYLSVSYSKFTAVLLKGIQEQQETIKDQQTQINQLQTKANRVDNLEERLINLEQQNQQAAGLPFSTVFFFLGFVFIGGMVWMIVGKKKALQGFGTLGGLAVMAILFFMGMLIVASPAQAQEDPDCENFVDLYFVGAYPVEGKDSDDEWYMATFASNIQSKLGTFDIAAGIDNYFSPPPSYRGQPETFYTDGDIQYHGFLWIPEHLESFTWNLCGHTATVSLADINPEGSPLMELETNSGNTVLTVTDSQFRARMPDGVRFYTEETGNIGVALEAGGAAWTVTSDSTRKENFREADGERFLQEIRQMDLGSWSFREQPDSVRHYGPMSQDFFNAFGHDDFGTIGSDTTIATMDADGVLFIAAKALAERTGNLQNENRSLHTELKEVEKRLEMLEQHKNQQATIPWKTGILLLILMTGGMIIWRKLGQNKQVLFTKTAGLLITLGLILYSSPTTAQTFSVENGASVKIQNGGLLDLGDATTLNENGGHITDGSIKATRSLDAPSDENVAGLGAILTSDENLGETVIIRTHGIETVDGGAGINRYFDIAPANNSGLDATLVFTYYDSELNSLEETELELYRSEDEGNSYTNAGFDSRDASANSITLGNIDSFSRWTAAAQQESVEFTKSFKGAAAPGNSVTLQFTIENNPDEALSNLTFTDDLDATLSGLVAVGLPKNDVCGAGSTITGISLLTFTGRSLPPESSCTFDVSVQIPAGAASGDYVNTTSDLTSEGITIAGSATDELTIQSAVSGNNGEVLASNQNGYTFTPDDFGHTNDNNFVHIETLPDHGTLKLDDSEVVVDQDIPVSEISDNNLMWMGNDQNAYGINYDEFEFKIKNSSELESEDTYTLTIDLAAATVDLDGSEGWRFMTSPSDGEPYSSLLDPISIETASASFPTLYELDQDNYEWDAVGNMGSEIDPGKGFIVLVEEDDLPATLTSDEQWEELDGSFTYSDLDYDGDGSSANPGNFYLLANPHPVALNFCEFTDSEIATSIYVWNPDEGGGNGDYKNVSCNLEDNDVPIAPFQAFWVRTTAPNPTLAIPEEAYQENTEPGYFKDHEQEKVVTQKTVDSSLETSEPSETESSEKSILVNREFAIVLSIQDKENEFSNSTHILFSSEATPGLDPIDAPKLSASGLAERWLSLHSLDQEGNRYALQSLPPVAESTVGGSTQTTEQQNQTTIPVDLQTTENRSFTLSWDLPNQKSFDGQYFLKDTGTGKVIELREGRSYRFEIKPDQTSKVSKTLEVSEERSAKSGEDFVDLGGGSEARFELLVAATGVDGRTELGDLPDDFTLNQNYPNPFNPTTIISYELPESVQVRLDVYDMLGRHIATLVNEQASAGRHTVNFDASRLSSGVYLYRLQAGSMVKIRKLTVLK